MFSLNHFLWLGIAVLVNLVLLLLNKKFKWGLKENLTIMVVISVISELVKIFNNMELGYKDGRYLDPGSLPFHLCTIQIFFFIALRFFIRDEKKTQALLNFMFPMLLLGGILAMCIPTCGVTFVKVQTYQYFIYHMFIVYFAIYLIISKKITTNWKSLLLNYIYLSSLMISVMWVNSFLSAYNTNFFYLCRPPMDNLPLLNLDHGWYVYFITLFTIAVVLLGLVQLPFILINTKKEKQAK